MDLREGVQVKRVVLGPMVRVHRVDCRHGVQPRQTRALARLADVRGQSDTDRSQRG
jgi:membrane protein YdbS with pleckstrin-like domain